ncbi:MAG: ABC transporter permease [Alphaproteobacteria bacterium]|nr:ABC transporter permease [Alphaproteobacteria bacterium]
MSALSLALAYLRKRPFNTALNLAMLALGVGTIALLLLFSEQLEDHLVRDAKGIDMVVGAKGSPLQLILSSVFHVDIPTGNVRIADARTLTQHSMVEAVIPMALGDSFRGYRIVGTEAAYPAHFEAELASGAWWQAPLEATIGARVAADVGMGVGDQFSGAHGLSAGGGAGHEETPYRVVGVMAPTGTVLDRLILTSVESVWEVHAVHEDEDEHEAEHEEEHEAEHEEEHIYDNVLAEADPEAQVTALLVRFRSPIAAAQLPRLINMSTPMQAALPAYEMARMMMLIGVGVDGFRAFALVLVVSAGLGIFAALSGALAQRRYDIAVMRSLGATRGVVLRQILLEGFLLALAGTLLGLLLGHGAAAAAGDWLWREHQLHLSGLEWVAGETWLVLLALLLGLVAAALPAITAYRIDVSQVLARGSG